MESRSRVTKFYVRTPDFGLSLAIRRPISGKREPECMGHFFYDRLYATVRLLMTMHSFSICFGTSGL